MEGDQEALCRLCAKRTETSETNSSLQVRTMEQVIFQLVYKCPLYVCGGAVPNYVAAFVPRKVHFLCEKRSQDKISTLGLFLYKDIGRILIRKIHSTF
jgi:hypothetical protein